ncbi:MAG: divergent polysaccharide deacetylase family protein [Gammaproteobacteria bacterium]|nr:divergent polysaccharide deacetylase family protein [Gammaproteobacteria bacterium]
MIKKLWVLGIVILINNAHADKPALSLVIDDLGYSFEQAKQVFQLPGEHTYAIIPSTTYSQKIARYAHQNGHEIILHMPMQSSVDLVIESTALLDNMSEEEITHNVARMIQEVPYIKGINNHMGSKLTEMGYIMRPVMETIKQQKKNFYFLDSRTTPLSKAYQQALRAGVPTLKRDVFLDYDHTNAESIAYQFKRWLKKAQRKGHAVAIAHPYQSTMTLLKQKIEATKSEFDYMTASQLIAMTQKEKNSWPKYLSHWQQDSKN